MQECVNGWRRDAVSRSHSGGGGAGGTARWQWACVVSARIRRPGRGRAGSVVVRRELRRLVMRIRV
jgi:hypothetical protein